MPPLFVAGVLCNWIGIGLLAWKPDQTMLPVALILATGTATMFLGAYLHRPNARPRERKALRK
jgi:hypothetical protein